MAYGDKGELVLIVNSDWHAMIGVSHIQDTLDRELLMPARRVTWRVSLADWGTVVGLEVHSPAELPVALLHDSHTTTPACWCVEWYRLNNAKSNVSVKVSFDLLLPTDLLTATGFTSESVSMGIMGIGSPCIWGSRCLGVSQMRRPCSAWQWPSWAALTTVLGGMVVGVMV